MDGLYPSLDGYIKSISTSNPDYSHNLQDYYIKTAYNCCNGGSYKNDYVNLCNLKAIIKQGVRGLDFEIFSVNGEPVISSSTTEPTNYYTKETLNSIPFTDVIKTISQYAFSSSTSPNPNDPIIIHLRIKSQNQEIYTKMANIFEPYSSTIMLDKKYSFENYGHNLSSQPLIKFMNRIIIIVDKTNPSFLENKAFLEYVNMTSNSMFMRGLTYNNVANTPDLNELQDYNRKNMTIVFPERGANPSNPSGILAREAGCQLIAMRYQLVDNFLEENTEFFDREGSAFILKPERLRYIPVTIPNPIQQDPSLSYQTRTTQTDYYKFDF